MALTTRQLWLLVGAAAVLIVGILAAALAIASGDDDDSAGEEPTPTATVTKSPDETETPTVSPTSGVSPTPTATVPTSPTPDDQFPGLIRSVAGHDVILLEKLDPIAFPPDLVLYFNTTCYACEGGYALQRAYRDMSGDVVVDPIRPGGAAPRGRTDEPYVHSFRIEPDGSDAFAIVCTGYCGGVAEIEPGSTAELWHSTDGAVTWRSIAKFEVESYMLLAGVSEGRALLMKLAIGNNPGPTTFAWYPGGEQAIPPMGFANPVATDVPGYGLAWLENPETNAPLRVQAFTGSGVSLVRPDDSRFRWSLMEVTPDGFFIWNGYPPSTTSTYSYVAFATPDGEVDRVYTWKGYDFRVIDGLDNRLFVGNALTTGDDSAWVNLPNGSAAFEPVVIDFDAETVAPIAGLPPNTNEGVAGPYSFPLLALRGTFVRVESGDECLNLRKEPQTDSEPVGCFADGVLLRVREGQAPVDGWTPVQSPQGDEGWAASEFLSRAAGGAE